MFLIYNYMERGSLFCILNNDVEAIELDWSKRLNIIKGIVHALSYMGSIYIGDACFWFTSIWKGFPTLRSETY
jgi:hypothetical protein